MLTDLYFVLRCCKWGALFLKKKSEKTDLKGVFFFERSDYTINSTDKAQLQVANVNSDNVFPLNVLWLLLTRNWTEDNWEKQMTTWKRNKQSFGYDANRNQHGRKLWLGSSCQMRKRVEFELEGDNATNSGKVAISQTGDRKTIVRNGESAAAAWTDRIVQHSNVAVHGGPKFLSSLRGNTQWFPYSGLTTWWQQNHASKS